MGPCEGALPEDLLDSWHGHGVEVDPAGGQLPWRQHGTRRRPVPARRRGWSPSCPLPGDNPARARRRPAVPGRGGRAAHARRR
jgi:hypothetical protein